MPTKKAAAKKPSTRSRKAAPVTMELMREPEPFPEPMPGPGTSKSRVVYFAGCRNCDHLPIGVNAVLTVLVAIIFTLSAMLMASSVSSQSVAGAIASAVSR